ncbi:hypothetical protein L596_030843 [Steinernema carpocapsae]|uniref:Uncharacterized protein n=1 Tax=Steinernema carpocapsae TaxID=34508 RepID=A0A4U5LNA9_STECR|nr:hypothetical protein L596_030843 [Steinernema carpocapsae]
MLLETSFFCDELDTITSEASTSSSPQMSLLGKAKTAAMSRISGVRRLKTPHGTTGNVPEYGVECAKEIAVYMQQGARSGKFCAQKKDGFILRWVTSITSRALFALTGVLLCARGLSLFNPQPLALLQTS